MPDTDAVPKRTAESPTSAKKSWVTDGFFRKRARILLADRGSKAEPEPLEESLTLWLKQMYDHGHREALLAMGRRAELMNVEMQKFVKFMVDGEKGDG